MNESRWQGVGAKEKEAERGWVSLISRFLSFAVTAAGFKRHPQDSSKWITEKFEVKEYTCEYKYKILPIVITEYIDLA